jgi:hypothetical protein
MTIRTYIVIIIMRGHTYFLQAITAECHFMHCSSFCLSTVIVFFLYLLSHGHRRGYIHFIVTSEKCSWYYVTVHSCEFSLGFPTRILCHFLVSSCVSHTLPSLLGKD